MDEFVEEVLRQMDVQGVTMAELARRAECGRPYLYRVFRTREQKPSFDFCVKIANVLGITIKTVTVGK